MALSLNVNKFLRGLILVTLTLFMIHLRKTGGIDLLVSPLIAKIITFSILPFGVISLLTVLYSFSPRGKKHEHDHPHDHDSLHEEDSHHHFHHHDHLEDDGHNHANPHSFWSRMTFVLLVLSMVVAYVWHPVALGTNMIGNQSQVSHKQKKAVSNGTTPSSVQPVTSVFELQNQTGSTGMMKDSGKNSEAYIAFNYTQDPSKFLGKNETLQGFVYHPVGLPSDYLILTRFYIFCCIADASPIGIAVKSKEASQLKNNTWVNVSGTIQTQDLPILSKLEPTQNWVPTGSSKPVLISKSMQVIPTPKKPYAIPSF